MTTFLLRRIALIVPTLFFVSLLIFGLQQLLPGDPAMALAGEDRDPSVIAFLREKYHLDQPLPVRYALWIGGVVYGDLGESIRTRRPVLDEIGFRYLNTLELTFAALLVAIIVGVISGIVAAYRRDTWLDVTATTVSLFGISMHAFFFGLVVILVFSVWLHWLSVIPRGWTALLMPAATRCCLASRRPASRSTTR